MRHIKPIVILPYIKNLLNLEIHMKILLLKLMTDRNASQKGKKEKEKEKKCITCEVRIFELVQMEIIELDQEEKWKA